jgi:hypothetical protein
MPTSQDWNVVIIGGPLAIRHRRAVKPRKMAMGIIADRAGDAIKVDAALQKRQDDYSQSCGLLSEDR